MTHSFKLSRRIARLRVAAFAAIAVALAGCDSTEGLNPDSSTPAGVVDESFPAGSIDEGNPVEEGNPLGEASTGTQVIALDAPGQASVAFAGGIPIGTYAQPTSTFGDRYNGGLRNIWPQFLKRELENIKNRGGKVVLMMAGNERHYKGQGHFSLNKWKARIDRFKGVDFESYINDGTIVGHYLIDEPNDPVNWGNRPIPGSTLEEMAKYSKQLWSRLATVVRVDPAYLAGGRYQHLDAAWAQYVYRKGAADDHIRRNVADASRLGLGLITGLNIIKGGPNGSRMTASQVKSWGSTLLESSYPCAFISWQYNSGYLDSGDMRDAMDALRRKAENRSPRSCRGS
ncbi:MAG: hypothetical protein ACR2HK_09265 [Gemmatimonadales bacterium]